MLPLGIDKLSIALSDLRTAVEFQRLVHRHFSEEPDLSTTAEAAVPHYSQARLVAPHTPTFQIYTHCASVTRLYAVYEAYVYELVRSWLAELCALAKTWSDLPESLCTNYRSGIGSLLHKYGGSRTAHLTELKIVESLHRGLASGSAFDLIPEAFFIDLQNLRESELISLFSRVGLPDLALWLKAYLPLSRYCQQHDCSVVSRLKDLIEYRNEAAHGAIAIDEVIGQSEFLLLLEFVQTLCAAISEFVRFNLIRRAESLGYYRTVGKVTEFFAVPQISIATMRPTRVVRGDSVLVRSASSCYPARIQSIQNNDVDVEAIDIVVSQELGICLVPAARRGAELLVAVQPN